jgi:hypothetical protein
MDPVVASSPRAAARLTVAALRGVHELESHLFVNASMARTTDPCSTLVTLPSIAASSGTPRAIAQPLPHWVATTLAWGWSAEHTPTGIASCTMHR